EGMRCVTVPRRADTVSPHSGGRYGRGSSNSGHIREPLAPRPRTGLKRHASVTARVETATARAAATQLFLAKSRPHTRSRPSATTHPGATASSDVHIGQRLAPTGIALVHSGHSLLSGSSLARRAMR